MWLSWAWNSSLSTSNLAQGCCWDKLNCHGHQCQTFSRSRMFSIYFNHSKAKRFTWQRYSQTMTLNIWYHRVLREIKTDTPMYNFFSSATVCGSRRRVGNHNNSGLSLRRIYSIWLTYEDNLPGWWFGTWILWILWISIQLGTSSSQLTNSIIFRGVGLNHHQIYTLW